MADEERAQRERKSQHELMEKRVRARLETIAAYEEQLAEKKRRLEQDRIAEQKFREEVQITEIADGKIRPG